MESSQRSWRIGASLVGKGLKWQLYRTATSLWSIGQELTQGRLLIDVDLVSIRSLQWILSHFLSCLQCSLASPLYIFTVCHMSVVHNIIRLSDPLMHCMWFLFHLVVYSRRVTWPTFSSPGQNICAIPNFDTILCDRCPLFHKQAWCQSF